ncbi:MAG: lysoplasmalogenase [Gammaproteobacteria bacterium]|nr:lysoplasmalogenase [Gammaproteobacteria bacterium]
MKKSLNYLFFIILLADIFAIVTGNHGLQIVFKPLLMIVLGIHYRLSVARVNKLFVLALCFAFIGDVLLLFDSNVTYFLGGIASFLVMHLFYIGIFSTFLQKKSLPVFAKGIVPFLCYFSVILLLIFNQLNELLIPVLVYGGVISLFGTVCLVNYVQKQSTDNRWLLIGAVLFIISDSLIAINRFYLPHLVFEVLIITLYAISQWIICWFMVKNKHYHLHR